MIYFIQDTKRLLIKIGFTSKQTVKDRLQSARTWNTSRMAVLYLDEWATQEQERALHRRFRSSRYVGEWFKPTAEILLYLFDMGRGHGIVKGRQETEEFVNEEAKKFGISGLIDFYADESDQRACKCIGYRYCGCNRHMANQQGAHA